MNSPLISVIIPCYNIEKYVFKAVKSIRNQSYENIEIILVEDGSNDNTSSILELLNQEDDRIKIIFNEKNLGLANSLNKAVEKANGDYIARMDGDDISHPDRLKIQLEYLTKNPAISVVGCKSLPIDEGDILQSSSVITFCSYETLKLSCFLTNPFVHGSILVKSDVFKRYKYKNIGSEDFELWCNINSNNLSFANIDRTLYYFRRNQNSYSTLNEIKQIKSHNNTSKKYLSEFMNMDIDQQSVDIINHRPIEIVNIQHLRRALIIFNSLLERHKIPSREFNHFVTIQYLNIFIQSFKKSQDFKTKAYIIFHFLKWNIKHQGFQMIILLNKMKIENRKLENDLKKVLSNI